jgi:RimJ/RimL family protein N-acetyltransferase
MSTNVKLRETIESDLPFFFAQQSDPESIAMAAFVPKNPKDPIAFTARWRRILDDQEIIKRTILVENEIAGSVAKFEMFNRPEISYWIDRRFWGEGVATSALADFLALIPTRPIFARAASHNGASLRVLEKCGFEIEGRELAFANAAGAEIEETLLKLDGPANPTSNPG